MGGTTVEDIGGAAPRAKLTISMPPRGSMDSIFSNGLPGIGFSLGLMMLVSSFFSDQGPFSFSQLLAGAMASPMAPKSSLLLSDDSGKEEKRGYSCEDEKNGEGGGGYKQNRPMNLVVILLFMFSAGFSSSGLLNSPGFLSSLQDLVQSINKI